MKNDCSCGNEWGNGEKICYSSPWSLVAKFDQLDNFLFQIRPAKKSPTSMDYIIKFCGMSVNLCIVTAETGKRGKKCAVAKVGGLSFSDVFHCKWCTAHSSQDFEL